ncbi:MAG: hypothetical protein IJH70_05915 [Oscillospiraceae bacterium]|nr:hypothetical protein [Oscillospiraceae bacterium]
MTTAKTFDIHDYDFLYEDEIDVLEAETLQEAEPGYTGAHNVASGKQKSEGSVRQAMTDTARKAKEKGSKLWKSTENVRENTARTAKEKSTQLWNSTAGARKQAKQIWNNSTQRIKEVSSSPDARTLTELEDRTRSFFLVCGATAALWLMQMILSFIPTIHMRVMDLISYENGTFSLNTLWATDGGHGIDAAIIIPIVMGILSLLSVRSLMLPIKQNNPEKPRFFALSKISVFLSFFFVLIAMTMVDDANNRSYGLAGAENGFAPVVYLINCILISVLNIVASCKNRKLRSRIKATSAEE